MQTLEISTTGSIEIQVSITYCRDPIESRSITYCRIPGSPMVYNLLHRNCFSNHNILKKARLIIGCEFLVVHRVKLMVLLEFYRLYVFLSDSYQTRVYSCSLLDEWENATVYRVGKIHAIFKRTEKMHTCQEAMKGEVVTR